MAYATPAAKSASDVMSLADYNVVRNNFIAMAPDIFTTLGDLHVATNADVGARLGIGPDDAVLCAASGASAGMNWHISPFALAYNNANRALSAWGWTNITMDSEEYDTNSIHDTVSSTHRMSVPAAGEGMYAMGARVVLETSAVVVGTTGGMRLLLNGSITLAEYVDSLHTGTCNASIEIHTLHRLGVGDYVNAHMMNSQGVPALASGVRSQAVYLAWQRR